MDENLVIDEINGDVDGDFSSSVITEYEQTVLQRLDSIESVLTHQYTLGLFVTGCVTAVFVCVLLYKFLLRAFY